MPGQSGRDAHVQGVSLVVVHWRKSRRHIQRVGLVVRIWTNQSALDGRGGLRDLVGINRMRLQAMPQHRRTQRDAPAWISAAYQVSGQNRLEFPMLLIEPVPGSGLVVVDLHVPTALGNDQAGLALLVALTLQRRKGDVLAVSDPSSGPAADTSGGVA